MKLTQEQWNKLNLGHKIKTSGGTYEVVGIDVPGTSEGPIAFLVGKRLALRTVRKGGKDRWCSLLEGIVYTNDGPLEPDTAEISEN